MRTTKCLKYLLIGALAMALSSVVWARELRLPPGKWWENDKVVEALKLSAEQQGKIRDLVFEHALRMIDLKGNLERRELELANTVERTEFDPGAVRSAFAALQTARQKLEAEHLELLISIRQLLSTEQWQELQKLHEEFKRHRAMGDRPGQDRPRMQRPGDDRPPRPR